MWQINMGLHVSKMYGQHSKFHVFWYSTPPHPTPRGHTRSLKNLKFGFHKITDHKFDISIWAFIYFIDKHHALLAAGYIAPLGGAQKSMYIFQVCSLLRMCVNYGHFSHASDVWSFGITPFC